MKCENCLLYSQENCIDDCVYKPIKKDFKSKQEINNAMKDYRELINKVEGKSLSPWIKRELRSLYCTKIGELMDLIEQY